MPEQLTFADGKYTLINENGKLTALCGDGEAWSRDLTGDNLVYSMFVKVLELQARCDALEAREIPSGEPVTYWDPSENELPQRPSNYDPQEFPNHIPLYAEVPDATPALMLARKALQSLPAPADSNQAQLQRAALVAIYTAMSNAPAQSGLSVEYAALNRSRKET